MDKLSEYAQASYKELVYNDPDFVRYFIESTPISELADINIGSRPAKRTTSDRIQDLRAIPWVFSWMQSRYTLPGWYGIGSSLSRFLEESPVHIDILKEMYREWDFFAVIISNAEMSLAKADIRIAKLYSKLVKNENARTRIFSKISDEHEKSISLILTLSEQQSLLSSSSVLQKSIALRNPYVDALSYIQLELMSRLRECSDNNSEEKQNLAAAVLLSINGVAAGLKNTG
jgi:phosphoenolpyruvate carboxylase